MVREVTEPARTAHQREGMEVLNWLQLCEISRLGFLSMAWKTN